MTVPPAEFRNAMARLGAAVNIVTTAGPGGRGGATASAVCSVTDSPATLLVCLNQSSRTNALVQANGVLCVNALSAGQRAVADAFAGVGGLEGEARFALGAWTELATGAPVLDGAVVSFDCRVVDVVEKGTHSVLFAEIVAIRTGAAVPALIWFARDYHLVGQAA